MAGMFIFDPRNPDVGLSTATNVGVGVFLDILTDTLYYTDGSTIFEWEGGISDKTYKWRSRKVRFPQPINLGAVLVEAESFVDITFRLYANIDNVMVLKHTEVVANSKPFRVPGGYLSNIYQVELEGVDIVNGVSIAESIFDLKQG
jgi:hypothetical protein